MAMAPFPGTLTASPAGDVPIARWGEDGTARYRIPALTCSARGTVIAAFDARPSMSDLPEHMCVVQRRSTDGGRTFERRGTVLSDRTWSHGDPSLITDHVRDRVLCLATSTVYAGFAHARVGNNPEDPHSTQIVAAISDDDGLSWDRQVITAQVKDPRWKGMFATSGEGVQLRSPRFRGRLVQPCVVRIGDANFAVMVWSDDHGESWQHGEPVGPGADENAVAELADGRLLLNTRATGLRHQAVSTDGGRSFSALTPMQALADPGNNGSLHRADTGPPDGTGREMVLLLTHTPDPEIRQNLSLTCSFDEGGSWPAQQLLVPGSTGYSTLTRLEDGAVGILYEHEGYSGLSFRRVPLADLTAGPLLLGLEGTPLLTSDRTATVHIRVRNTSRLSATKATVHIEGDQERWSPATAVPPLGPGQEEVVAVQVAVPAGVAGVRTLALRATCSMPAHPFAADPSALQSAQLAKVEILPAGEDLPALTVEPVIDAVYPVPELPGLLGDLAVPWVRVRNAGNVTVEDVTLRHPTGTILVHIGELAPGASTTVRDREAVGHRLTKTDLAAGSWSAAFLAVGRVREVAVTARARTAPLALD